MDALRADKQPNGSTAKDHTGLTSVGSALMPDGGTGHPDHRIVGNLATQLQRMGAPGAPERVFYMNLPVEEMRAMNPPRPEPPLVVPQAKFFTVRVPFAPEDLQAA